MQLSRCDVLGIGVLGAAAFFIPAQPLLAQAARHPAAREPAARAVPAGTDGPTGAGARPDGRHDRLLRDHDAAGGRPDRARPPADDGPSATTASALARRSSCGAGERPVGGHPRATSWSRCAPARTRPNGIPPPSTSTDRFRPCLRIDGEVIVVPQRVGRPATVRRKLPAARTDTRPACRAGPAARTGHRAPRRRLRLDQDPHPAGRPRPARRDRAQGREGADPGQPAVARRAHQRLAQRLQPVPTLLRTPRTRDRRLLRPHTSPTRTSTAVEARVLAARADLRRGAVYLAGELGLVASTVGRILHATGARAGRGRPDHRAPLDAATPGSATNAASPVTCSTSMSRNSAGSPTAAGGAARAARQPRPHASWPRDRLRLPARRHRRPHSPGLVEALPDEHDATCAEFLYRAVTWFRGHGVTVLRVLTDNAKVYRVGRNWRAVCVGLGLRRRFTKPGCPWTNGKAERFNRTLQNEFAYARPWLSNTDRLAALPDWVDHYNTRRPTPPSAVDPRSPDSPHDRQQRPGSVHLALRQPLRWLVPPHPRTPDRRPDPRPERKPPFPYEIGPKDVIYVGENEVGRVIGKFGPRRGGSTCCTATTRSTRTTT